MGNGSAAKRASFYANGRCSRKYLLVLLIGMMLCTIGTQAQTFSVLYGFTGGSDGIMPLAGVTRDSAGNLYGTTLGGGDHSPQCQIADPSGIGCGVVFKVDPEGNETILHRFTGGTDGGSAGLGVWGSLAIDSAGNLYGTRFDGGDVNNPNCGGAGCGVVFKVDTAGHETVLHTFELSETDGGGPTGGVIRDAYGNLYGTTTSGGTFGDGTVYKISSSRTFSILYSFSSGPDGFYPWGELSLDAQGNLYGTTAYGGDLNCAPGVGPGCGVIFKISSSGSFVVLHTFEGSPADGAFPSSAPVLDNAGNLYGTTPQGGAICVYLDQGEQGCGTIFKITPSGQETVLYDFPARDFYDFHHNLAPHGRQPSSGVLLDAAGNLYGVTITGGTFRSREGALFRLSPEGEYSVLHSFSGGEQDGGYPYGQLIQDNSGNLYGTASMGDDFLACSGGCGVVFRVTP